MDSLEKSNLLANLAMLIDEQEDINIRSARIENRLCEIHKRLEEEFMKKDRRARD